MQISTTKDGSQTILHVTGSLDTNTSPALEAEVEKAMDSCPSVTFDFDGLDYISSSGLRVVMAAYKRALDEGGSVCVTGTNDEVREVFSITGFTSIISVA